jgi:hypothetical protein
MYKKNCPHCGFKLGNFLYADACPSCKAELTFNTRQLITAPVTDSGRVRSWPVRVFFRAVRLVES